MAFNDNAVFTASTGFLYIADVGTAAPTPRQLTNFDPETFGAHQFTLKVAGTADYTLSVADATTDPIKPAASAAEVQAALQQLKGVGTGNVVVEGTDPKQGYTVSFVGDSFGKTVALEGGSGATVTEFAKPLGWAPIGHTSNEDLPEFGYDGGDSETKGSWQKKVLREITSEAPVDYITVNALQFDEQTFELYYGKNASKQANVFGVDAPGSEGVEKAILLVMRDGLFKIAFSAAKASVRREESISLESDDFAALPLRATFVKHPGRHLYEWTIPEK